MSRCWQLAAIYSTLLVLCPALPADLIARWSLDGNLLDAAGGHDATYAGTGGPRFVADPYGVAGDALSLNTGGGSGEHIGIAPGAGLAVHALPAFSLVFFVKAPAPVSGVTDRKVFCEASTASDAPVYSLGTAPAAGDRGLDFFVRTDANDTLRNHVRSILPVFDGSWHHVAWIDDGGTVTCIIDGVEDLTDFDYVRAPLTTDTTSLGALVRAAAGSWLGGSIDDVRIFDRAITLDEARAIFRSGCPATGDTTCTDLLIDGHPSGEAGIYTLVASGEDASGDTTLYYTFRVVDGLGNLLLQQGPQTLDTAMVGIGPGTWTVSVAIDDNPSCGFAVCSRSLTVTAPPALVARWSLDGSIDDVTGNGNDGSFSGATSPSYAAGFDGTPGGALRFDGTDDFVGINPTWNLPITLFPARTIALWAKGSSQANRALYAEASSTNGNPLLCLGTDAAGASGKADIFLRADDGTGPGHVLTGRVVFDGAWHHIAMVDDGSRITVYIDGAADVAFDHDRRQVTTNQVSLGAIRRSSAGNFFAGTLDDVRLYNRALSAAEISDLVPEIHQCPDAGDTHCRGLSLTGPADGFEGTWTATAEAADETGDAIAYTFRAVHAGTGDAIAIGPQAGSSAEFSLVAGTWTVSVEVDDDPLCPDAAADASCSTEVTVRTCPASGDTHCRGLSVEGPAGGLEGTWTATAEADDDSGDAIRFAFRAVRAQSGETLVAGPQPGSSASFALAAGAWTISVEVDDDPLCPDSAADAACSKEVSVRSCPASGDTHCRGLQVMGPLEDVEGLWTATAEAADDSGDPIEYTFRARPAGSGEPIVVGPQSGNSAAFALAAGAWTVSVEVDDDPFCPDAAADPGCTKEISVLACPAAGDTHCTILEVTGPTGDLAGIWTATATGTDATGDPLAYTFLAESGAERIVIGPQSRNSADFELAPGAWTVSVAVDDDPDCPDAADDAACSKAVAVLPCPAAGDTHCAGLTVTGPADGSPGAYTATAAATDDSGDAVLYTFRAAGGSFPAIVVGPQAESSAVLDLAAGTWTVSAEVDDDPACTDAAGDRTCSREVIVADLPAGVGPFIRGDANDDGVTDLSDAITILRYLFLAGEIPPCMAAANVNGEGSVTLTSAIYLLNSLFLGGPQPLPPSPGCGTSTLDVDLELGCGSYGNCP